MVWTAKNAWDQAAYTNPSGEPLFLIPPASALGYNNIGMPQRLPNNINDVETGINHRSDTHISTKRIGPTSGREIESTPITIANMYHIGSIRMAHAFRKHIEQQNKVNGTQESAPFVSIPKQLTKTQIHKLLRHIKSNEDTGNIVLTVGSDEDSIKRMDYLDEQIKAMGLTPQEAIKTLHYDNPNLNTPKAFSMVKYWRGRYPETYLLAGNTNEPEIARHIASIGADCVKVGIGPGAMCTTSLMTGICVPQATAVAAVVQSLRNEDGTKKAHVMADGGIRHPRDWGLALALGADDVMFASVFGGYPEGFETDRELEAAKFEGPDGKILVPIFGSASRRAIDTYHHNKADWHKTAEGRAAGALLQPYSATALLDQYRGGLRSLLTMRGVGNIEDFQRNVQLLPIAGSPVDHSVHTHSL